MAEMKKFTNYLNAEIKDTSKDTFDIKLMNKKFPEDDNFNNCIMEITMTFLYNCQGYSIRVELDALIENLLDKRRGGWKQTIYDKKGPKTMKELEDEYAQKQRKLYGRDDSEEDYYSKHNNKRNNRGARHVEDDDNEYVLANNAGSDRFDGKKYGSSRNFEFGKHKGKRSPQKYDNNNRFANYNQPRFNKHHDDNKRANSEDEEAHERVKRVESNVTDHDDYGFDKEKGEEQVENKPRFARKHSSNKEVMMSELKEFFKNNKNCADKDTYIAWFFERKDDWNKTGSKPGQYLFEGFF